MAVHVDDMQAPYGRMLMCHMAADSTAELLTMADRIGVDRRWLQHAGAGREHFDICMSKKAAALAAGAIPATTRRLCTRRWSRGDMTVPDAEVKRGR